MIPPGFLLSSFFQKVPERIYDDEILDFGCHNEILGWMNRLKRNKPMHMQYVQLI